MMQPSPWQSTSDNTSSKLRLDIKIIRLETIQTNLIKVVTTSKLLLELLVVMQEQQELVLVTLEQMLTTNVACNQINP